METWLPVEDAPGYLISDKGRVKSLKKYASKNSRYLKLSINSDGYHTVHIPRDDKVTNRTVHRLVLKAFQPTVHHGSLVINHKNGVKTDNRLNNLEWCSVKYNNDHAIRSGLAVHVKTHRPTEKINKKIADQIRAEYIPRKISRNHLAKKYGLHKSHIDRILAGLVWV